MIHIIVIHSNISIIFLKAFSAIVEPDNIKVITDKRYHATYKNFDFSFKAIYENSESFWDWRKFKKNKKALQTKINLLSGGYPYNLYLPHTRNPFYAALASSSFCQTYYVYEEGFLAHSYSKSSKSLLKFCRLNLINFISNGYYYFKDDWLYETKKFKNYYYFFDGAFSTKQNKIKLDLKDIKAPTIENINGLFILDALLEFELCYGINFFSEIDAILDFFRENNMRIGIKFHPSSSSEVKDYVIKKLGIFNVPYSVLNDELILEEVILMYNKCKYEFSVIGFVSSLLYYSSLIGIPTISYAKRLAKKDIKFNEGAFKRIQKVFNDQLFID